LVPNADATSLFVKLPSDSEYFEEPTKNIKGKAKQKVKGNTHALITSKRVSAIPKMGTDSGNHDTDITMGDTTKDDVVSKRKHAFLKSV
jgi:hypothetical protein